MVQNIIVAILMIGVLGFLVDSVQDVVHFWKGKDKVSKKIRNFYLLKSAGLTGIIIILAFFLKF